MSTNAQSPSQGNIGWPFTPADAGKYRVSNTPKIPTSLGFQCPDPTKSFLVVQKAIKQASDLLAQGCIAGGEVRQNSLPYFPKI